MAPIFIRKCILIPTRSLNTDHPTYNNKAKLMMFKTKRFPKRASKISQLKRRTDPTTINRVSGSIQNKDGFNYLG